MEPICFPVHFLFSVVCIPNVRLEIREAHSNLLEGMLLNGDADLAFFNLPVKSPDIDYQIISHEEVVLVLGNDHPLKDKGLKKEGCKYPWLDLDLLENESFILQPPDQEPADSDQLFKSYHIHPKYAFRPAIFPLLRSLPPRDTEPAL